MGWRIEKQISKVREIITQHYREQEGRCHQFGNITGYVYRRTYDDSIEFSVDGEVIHASLGKIDEGPELELYVGNKVVVEELLNLKPKEAEPK